VTDANPFDEIERVIETMSQGFGVDLAGIQVDVVDEGDAFVLYADVPGVDPADVDVRLSDGRDVTIDMSAESETEVGDGEYVRRERTHRSTTRTVSLPEPVVEEEASASVDEGVLEVRLPKRATDDTGTEIPVE